MKHPRIIFIILLSLLGIFLFYQMVLSGYSAKLNGEQTDCFDRYANKIDGQICYVEGGYDTRTRAVVFNSLLGFLLFLFFTMIGVVLGQLVEMQRELNEMGRELYG